MNPEQALDYPHAAPPAPGEVQQVAPGVHWLRMPLPYALDHINLWLLEDGDGYAIVDCGIGDGITRELWERIFAGFVRGKPITRVFATHCHPDHMGNAHWLTTRFGTRLWTSQGEFLAAHAWHDDAAGFTVGNLVEFFLANGLDEARLAGFRERGNVYRRGVPELPLSFRRVMDGDAIDIGGRTWRAVMGYGHAPEHMGLYCDALQVFISGDMVLPRISTNVPVQSVDPDLNALKLFLDSLARYARELPAATLVLPSHGLPFRGLHERVAQLAEHHRLRLGELEEACGTPKSAADVIGVLFRRQLDTHQTFFAMGEAIAHMNYLWHGGAFTRSKGADGVIRFARI